ncbi:MAG: PfaD family polyunsaturated fatty acid/polyketide biosynthesis protein [Proteobacteria bacterium]|nr:PfaD family polyunsaturated fatty acid/polyketide biosynthesis protein [Pseudomonadota bacterium]
MKRSYHDSAPLGVWLDQAPQAATRNTPLHSALLHVKEPIAIIQDNEKLLIRNQGHAILGKKTPGANEKILLAYAPALPLENLGDPLFMKSHKLKYPYVMGAMANGITSADMVEEAARAGMVGFFGAGGLSLDRISQAIDRIQKNLAHLTYGFNLIHNPNEPQNEQAVVDLYLHKKVRLVSAAAYMRLTAPLVQYRITGIHRDAQGKIVCPNKVIAKVSRSEVARRFFSPPPEKTVQELVRQGKISIEEAELAKYIPMAQDLSAEADSGGHTDNRPALALFPTMMALRHDMMKAHGYDTQLRVGLGGGIATPESAAAAFAMGAAYILTGSINQSCLEAGTSDAVKKMLCVTEQADVIMAPSADMFEMGVKVQVLKRGTMFALKAAKLYDYYRTYDSLDQMPSATIEELEKKFFHTGIDQEWNSTWSFFETRDPRQNERAARDPKHKMALLFRSYLGRASLWAVTGAPDRVIDYQVWCGPAMGAFNEWVKGSFLEAPEQRKVATLAMNLLMGASYVTRMNHLRSQGIMLSDEEIRYHPIEMDTLQSFL